MNIRSLVSAFSFVAYIHLVNKLDELNNSTKLVPETPQQTKKP